MAGILITGATGNIGQALLRFLMAAPPHARIAAGVRDPDGARKVFACHAGLDLIRFDFENPETFAPALVGIDTVFLLRPPHIARVAEVFGPLVAAFNAAGVRRVLFLSVQGAEKSALIPHYQIEKLLRVSGMDCIFLRPGYFMQNLTTTLLKDVREKRTVILPAGRAAFNWVDVENIGEACAVLLTRFGEFSGRALELTGSESLAFPQALDRINTALVSKLRFRDINPVSFYFLKRREGVEHGFILVLILLHFLARFQDKPRITDTYETLTGKPPTRLKEFAEREKALLER